MMMMMMLDVDVF